MTLGPPIKKPTEQPNYVKRGPDKEVFKNPGTQRGSDGKLIYKDPKPLPPPKPVAIADIELDLWE